MITPRRSPTPAPLLTSGVLVPLAPVVLAVLAVLVTGVLWWAAAPALAATADGRRPGGDGARAWPVGPFPSVERGWEPPDTVYGPGHRGVDLAAPPGTPVRAPAAGRVSFAGRVAGRGVVSVSLSGTGDPPLRTTYEPVDPLATEGDLVAAGQVVAVTAAGPSHCAAGCLHWGLLRGRVYLNPLSLLPPDLLRRPAPRL
ncbi:peptidase M23, partial [Streptomyces sp. 150FB]|uniref:M23 family metallopeptidase n=1 Tax=Streptomyces sp. 150FB TaxID=1576605 RepID=UPI000588EADA